jgi:surface protein
MFTDRQYNPVEVLSADTTGVTDMGSLFCDNTAIVSVASFYTGAVTDMGKMFCNCTGLTSIPTFDTHSVTDFSSMLSGCTGLTEVPLLDTSSGTDFTDFLHGCTGIAEIPDFDVSSATDCFRMCHGCVSVELGAYRLYGKLSSLDPVPMHSYCFKDCGLTRKADAPTSRSSLPRGSSVLYWIKRKTGIWQKECTRPSPSRSRGLRKKRS